MSALIALFAKLPDKAAFEAKQTEMEVAVPRACFADDATNDAVVQQAIAVAKETKSARGLTRPEFIAALAALPPAAADQRMADIKELRAGDRRMKDGINLREFQQQVRSARSEIDRAREAAEVREVEPLDLGDLRSVARRFITAMMVDGAPVQAYWRDVWYHWDGVCFREVTELQIHCQILAFMEASTALNADGKPMKVTIDKDMVKEILYHLTTLVVITATNAGCEVDPDRIAPAIPRRFMVFTNAILDLDRFEAGRDDYLRSHSPRYFTTWSLPYAFDTDAGYQRFLRYLGEAMENDPERILAIQLMIAYLLSGATDLHLVFVLCGVPRSGKGTLIRIITALLGATNVATPKVSNLVDRFNNWALLDKTMALVPDAHCGGSDVGQAVEVMLGISGEDGVQVDRKNLPILSGVRMLVRFVLVMNENVTLPDASGALSARMRVIPFLQSRLGREDPTLTDRLKEELAGIAQWALEGLRIINQIRQETRSKGGSEASALKKLMQPPAGIPYLERMRLRGSPVAAFIDERAIIDQTAQIDQKDLYVAFKTWCEQCGHKVWSESKFVDDLLAGFPVRERRPTLPDGSRPRQLTGITLRRTELRVLPPLKISGTNPQDANPKGSHGDSQ